MSARPLVSIAMPCHNTASLLPWALSSVVAQTCEDWECIVVDDGSVDSPGRVVGVFGDRRMRLIRLPRNVGRGAARQVALDAAQGRFLAKLDADDWIYPEKLARQLERMERRLDVALVSTGIAIEDAQGRIAGVRARGRDDACKPVAPLQRLAPPPLAHPPSMIRMEIAKRYRYDGSLRRSEDAAYLLDLLREHSHCVLHDVLYAYREYRSASQAAVLEAYAWRMRMFWRYRNRQPLEALGRTAESALKWGVYRAAFAAGQAGTLIALRSDSPTVDDVRRFEAARARVAEVHGGLFGAPAQLARHEAVAE